MQHMKALCSAAFLLVGGDVRREKVRRGYDRLIAAVDWYHDVSGFHWIFTYVFLRF